MSFFRTTVHDISHHVAHLYTLLMHHPLNVVLTTATPCTLFHMCNTLYITDYSSVAGTFAAAD
jgi:hypothetical protein